MDVQLFVRFTLVVNLPPLMLTFMPAQNLVAGLTLLLNHLTHHKARLRCTIRGMSAVTTRTGSHRARLGLPASQKHVPVVERPCAFTALTRAGNNDLFYRMKTSCGDILMAFQTVFIADRNGLYRRLLSSAGVPHERIVGAHQFR